MNEHGGHNNGHGTSAGGETLNQVREILFGAQARDIDGRFQQLEQLVRQQTEALRSELSVRLDALESHVKAEVSALSERVKAEQQARSARLEELHGESQRGLRRLEERLDGAEERSGNGLREAREQLLAQTKAVRDEAQRVLDQLSAEVARQVTRLEAGKTDRRELAFLLNDLAVRLHQDRDAPPAQ
ncbi:MAG: hypothetical protein U1E65_27820 [Myxococcota bacterium]